MKSQYDDPPQDPSKSVKIEDITIFEKIISLIQIASLAFPPKTLIYFTQCFQKTKIFLQFDKIFLKP